MIRLSMKMMTMKRSYDLDDLPLRHEVFPLCFCYYRIFSTKNLKQEVETITTRKKE